jgi:hypothetical protein
MLSARARQTLQFQSRFGVAGITARGLSSTNATNIEMTTAPTPNPNSLKFIPGVDVMGTESCMFVLRNKTKTRFLKLKQVL